MINLQFTTKQLVQKYYEERQSFYESYNVSCAQMLNYYSTAAHLFSQQGLDDEEIVSIITKGLGNYLLGKKNGVTPAQYVRNCMDVRAGKL